MTFLTTVVGMIALVALISTGNTQTVANQALTLDGAKAAIAAAVAAAKVRNAPDKARSGL